MSRAKYPQELIDQVIKDLNSIHDAKLVAQKHGIPLHAIYRFRRERLRGPEISKEKKIRELSKAVADKDLEIKILRELLKKTYQVMPIELL